MIISAKLKQFDWSLFILMMVLVSFGLISQYLLCLNEIETGISTFWRQLIFSAIGLSLFFFISCLDFRFIKSLSYPLYSFTLFLLILVLLFGKILRGVKGWFSLGPFTFQPAELAKLSVIVLLAKFWQQAQRPLKFSRFLLSFAIVAPAFFLITRQPDVGSASIIAIICLAVSLLSLQNKKHFFLLALILLIVLISSWFLLRDYQKGRILNYFNPNRDPFGQGYQINQSIIAIGSGKLLGRSFNLATQSQLGFLPATKTDFVFAVLLEGAGFLGCLLILGVYLFFLLHLIKIARSVYDNFSLILVLGIALYFFLQMIINVGMNLGLLPVIGVPLPFLSYGGSSLLTSMIAVALVENTVIHQPAHQTPLESRN